ncbi:hypothetical protein, partial [Bradyrhizobium ottawaense]|uniref:hypothetical protein n=2 Tax=Bradyrhizobium TaxID=374 RepID=UPI001AECF7E2
GVAFTVEVMGLASQPNPTPHQRYTTLASPSGARFRIRRASSTLKKMVNGEFDLRRLNDVTQQLLESKQIEQRFASTKTGGRPSHRWFAL